MSCTISNIEKTMGLEIDCGSLLLVFGLTCPDNLSGLTNSPEKPEKHHLQYLFHTYGS